MRRCEEVRDGLMRSAYRGRLVATPVTVLRPEPAAPAVQPIPAGTGLKWASPGGWMGTLPGERPVRWRRRRYGIDWYAEGRWYSLGRTWLTKWGTRRACRRVLRTAGAARVVIVLTRVGVRTSGGSSEPVRPATWSGDRRRQPAPAGGTE